MSSTAERHKAEAPPQVACAVITISDTRTLETDTGGQTIVELLAAAGHTIAARRLVKDDPQQVRAAIGELIDAQDVPAVLLTGGTGISSRDQTFEAIVSLLEKTLPGYGELFRMLSYQEIGSAAMLSRAIAGVRRRSVLFSMPGSPGAVRLAMDKLIVPELPHLVREARR